MYNNYKIASLSDYLEGLTGSQGHLNAPLYGAVGGTIGAGALGAAGHALGGNIGGVIGAGAGALLGGGMGAGLATANNAQTGAMGNIVGATNQALTGEAMQNDAQNQALMALLQQRQGMGPGQGMGMGQPGQGPGMGPGQGQMDGSGIPKQGSVMTKQAAARNEICDLVSDMVITKIASAMDKDMRAMDAYATKVAQIILANNS